MAAPNFDNRPSHHHNQQPYYPPPPGPGARPNSSETSFQQYSNYPPPPQNSSTGSATGYPSYQRDPRFSHPQQYPQQNGGYYPQATSSANGYAPSPVPSFGNQVAPFSDEKAHAQSQNLGQGYVPYAATYGYGPRNGHDRDRDSRSSGSDSRGERERERDRRGRHERKKSRGDDADSGSGRGKSKSRNPLAGLSDDQRGLGAGKLEERHERRRAERAKKDADWKEYYASDRPKMGRKDSSRSQRSRGSRRDEESDSESYSDRSRSRDRDRDRRRR
ncbi:hypothetical protein KVT40_006567 [Elsinoe batatas]|uniref:Uncharacterized protein n=1 Tax=Elsinoe batatas TaxID=2601811 RepID=A0A8K0L1Y1_9PEZI|nr:hypothetical protein KVT40_006567 [Elsinoe batatas]